VNVVLAGPVKGYVECAEEIAEARRETGSGVNPPVVLHAQMDVGKM